MVEISESGSDTEDSFSESDSDGNSNSDSGGGWAPKAKKKKTAAPRAKATQIQPMQALKKKAAPRKENKKTSKSEIGGDSTEQDDGEQRKAPMFDKPDKGSLVGARWSALHRQVMTKEGLKECTSKIYDKTLIKVASTPEASIVAVHISDGSRIPSVVSDIIAEYYKDFNGAMSVRCP
jgi:hypothetical protein